jgi:phosphohistidine phosphatase SixA
MFSESSEPGSDPTRRLLLAAAAAGPLAWLGSPAHAQGPTGPEAMAFIALLRQGGCAVLIRHAQTEPGTGDPPGFRLGACNTQRQLSLAGREQSRELGQWFAARRLVPSAVWSSQWCRCLDTAQLAFGSSAEWPALNSTFGESSRQPAQTRELRARLQQIAPRQFEVWVTHQVNMTDLTDEYPAMGEAFLVSKTGRVQARLVFA